MSERAEKDATMQDGIAVGFNLVVAKTGRRSRRKNRVSDKSRANSSVGSKDDEENEHENEVFDASQHQAWLLDADIVLNLFTSEYVSQSSMCKSVFKSGFEAVDMKQKGNFNFAESHTLTTMLLASKKVQHLHLANN